MQRSIFALELCFRVDPRSDLQGSLRQALAEHPMQVSAQDKWRFYRWLAELLRNNLASAEAGCWDFFDDDTRAGTDHEMWFQGMATREGARRSPSGLPDVLRGTDHGRFLTFTLSWLLQRGSPSERGLAQLCAVPEPLLWQRQTFHTILTGLPSVSFASVLSDVVYVIPRDPDWFLTAEDLRDPKFHYLRRIV